MALRADLPENLFQLHTTNRGMAVYDAKVCFGKLDAFPLALDTLTDTAVWET